MSIKIPLPHAAIRCSRHNLWRSTSPPPAGLPRTHRQTALGSVLSVLSRGLTRPPRQSHAPLRPNHRRRVRSPDTDNVSLPTSLFVFRIIWFLQALCIFHVNFRSVPLLPQKAHWNFNWDCINSANQFGDNRRFFFF